MKYLSIDIETTGLLPLTHQIIMISAVVEDTFVNTDVEYLPHFTRYVKHEQYIGEAKALSMNYWIFDEILSDKPMFPVVSQELMYEEFQIFVEEHFSKKVMLAGKNVGSFDLQFIKQYCPWDNEALVNKFSHRILDVGPYCMKSDDEEILNLSDLLLRYKLGKASSHNAQDDARDVIRVIRARNKELREMELLSNLSGSFMGTK